MADSVKRRTVIMAAGGIVFREGPKPRIAVVRLRRDKAWVLPKGKLNRGERALAAAKREVLEETGHEVSVHEFLGSMSYSFDGKIKIVQFWHMRAGGKPVREITNDVKAVKWLSLKQALETLTRAHERVFLANVGPTALKAVKQSMRDKAAKPNGGKRSLKDVPAEPVGQVFAGDRREGKPNPFVTAFGSIRLSHPPARRAG